MSRGGANVTVTIGAAFAGSFRNVLREADRELKSFGKRTSKSMKAADRAAGALGKTVTELGTSARGAHTAIGATAKALHAMRGATTHTVTAAKGMRTLAQESRAATKAQREHTAERRSAIKAERDHAAAVIKGARAQARAARSVKPVSLGSTIAEVPAVSRRTRSGVPAVPRGPLPPAPGSTATARPPRLPRAARGGGGAHGGGSGPRSPRGGHGARGSHAGGHNHDAAAVAGGVGAAVSAHGVWDAVKAGGEVNDLQVLLRLQGRTATEIQQATRDAQKIAAENPAISMVEAFKSIIDVADTGDRDMKKAARLAPVIANSAKMVALLSDDKMKGALGEGQSRFLARAIEDTGQGTKSEGSVKDYVNAVTAGTIATRGIFNPRELFQSIQRSGGSARGWSNEFTGEVLPALTMALGGSGTGDALYMFSKNFTKGQAQLSSAKAMMELGLINKNDLLYDGNKYLGVRPDSMPDADLLRSNPYDWFQKNVTPAVLKKAGITDVAAERTRFNTDHGNDTDLAGLSEDDKRAKLNDKFREHLDGKLQKGIDTFAKAKNFAKMTTDFIAQAEQIDAQRAMIRKQPRNATDIVMEDNFTAQIEKVKGAFHSLTAALGGPEVGVAISAMNAISSGLTSLASAANADPGATQKVMAAFAAVTAGFAGAGIAGLATTVALSAGPAGLAIAAIGASLAAWAALDWDGFSEAGNSALSAIEAVGSALKAVNSALGLDEDGKGTNAVGRMVSRYLGNNEESLSQTERNRLGSERDKAQAAYDATEGANAGFRGSRRAAAKADLDAKQAALDDLDARREKYARRNATPGARTVTTKSDPQTVIGDADAMSGKSSAVKAMEAAERKASTDAALAHAQHQDEARTTAIAAFQGKPQEPEAGKKVRPGQAKPSSFDRGMPPVSAENVVDVTPAPVAPKAAGPIPGAAIAGPVPGTQGAPRVPGAAPVSPAVPSPGAALAATGGKMTVDLAGPVSIKDEVAVKQPLQLTTPVLISAAGTLAVHDDALQGTMSGLASAVSSIAASSAATQANTAGILAACQAIAAKDFAPKITVQGGGAGSAGASRERASFSD